MDEECSLGDLGPNQQRCLLQHQAEPRHPICCDLVHSLIPSILLPPPSTPLPIHLIHPPFPLPDQHPPFLPSHVPVLCTAVEEMLLSTHTPPQRIPVHTPRIFSPLPTFRGPVPPLPPLLLPLPPPAPQLRTHHCLCGSHWPGLLGPPSVLTG